MREADLPTKYSETQEEARVSSTYEDPRRKGCAQDAAWPRPRAAISLIWRVRGHGSFKELSRARARRDGALWLRFVAGDGQDPPQIAYALGRKFGNAPKRNRLRRRMRAVLNDLASDLEPGGRYLFGADPSVGDYSATDLRASLVRLVGSAGK